MAVGEKSEFFWGLFDLLWYHGYIFLSSGFFIDEAYAPPAGVTSAFWGQ